MLRGSGGGGVVQGGLENFGGVLQNFIGMLPRNIDIILGILSSSQLIGTLVG